MDYLVYVRLVVLVLGIVYFSISRKMAKDAIYEIDYFEKNGANAKAESAYKNASTLLKKDNKVIVVFSIVLLLLALTD